MTGLFAECQACVSAVLCRCAPLHSRKRLFPCSRVSTSVTGEVGGDATPLSHENRGHRSALPRGHASVPAHLVAPLHLTASISSPSAHGHGVAARRRTGAAAARHNTACTRRAAAASAWDWRRRLDLGWRRTPMGGPYVTCTFGRGRRLLTTESHVMRYGRAGGGLDDGWASAARISCIMSRVLHGWTLKKGSCSMGCSWGWGRGGGGRVGGGGAIKTQRGSAANGTLKVTTVSSGMPTLGSCVGGANSRA